MMMAKDNLEENGQSSADAKMFPHTDFFFKHPTQKVKDLLLPKRQKNGGSPALFWREHA